MIWSFLRLKASGIRNHQPLLSWIPKVGRKAQRSSESSLIIFITLLLSLILVSIRDKEYISNIQEKFSDITVITLSTIKSPFVGAMELINDQVSLRQKVQQLTVENEQLKFLNHKSSGLALENDQLKSLMKVSQAISDNKQQGSTSATQGQANVKSTTKAPVKIFTAKVLNASGNGIVIENNDQLNFSKNQVVMGANGLIGRIHQVGANSAKVLTVSDGKSKIPAQIQRTGENVILVGQNNRELKVLHADSSVETTDEASTAFGNALENGPKEGDLLITSGFCGIFPKGLPVAVITKVSNESFSAKVLFDNRNIAYAVVIGQNN